MPIRSTYFETVVGTPPEGWTLGHFTLNLVNPSERIPIEAWRRDAFAVHQIAVDAGIIAGLSHAPTGHRIYTFTSMDDAAACADELLPLTNWSAITDRLPQGSELFPRAKRIIQRHHGLLP